MASLSSPTSCDDNKRYQYDVFLCFSGEDTRRTFVDHLNEALQRHGIRTFKDDERLEKGKEIKDELLNSIEDSKFCIIIFSRKYASSSWCLDELLRIMECHNTTYQTAFPVFYDVEPTEVRKQTGLVGEAFAKHTRKVVVRKMLARTVGKALARHSNKKLGKWRKALKDAANLCGWELKNTAHGHEAKVIKLIVERISLELRSINMVVDEKLIGMEQRMQDLDSYLEIGLNDVRMIGIKGMGGAGKTTLAQAIFDKVSFNFEGKSFVENVRENSKAPLLGLKKLQEQILRDVLKDNSITIGGVHEGKNLIRTMLCGKKVLMVLDDVDHKDQLEALAPDPRWFKPGSRIIITTRDEQVLIAHGVKWIHDVNLLSDNEALRLFHMHAFQEGIPSEEYEMESLQVVRYAAGLPLTIKVLGSFLCGQDKSQWMEALARLKTIPLKATLEKLELSYENLEDDYKEMFLDIACFNINWDKENAIRILESSGFPAINGLRVLQQKSLITIDKNWNSIGMHDHIVQMGKDIVRRKYRDEPHKHSRLWVQEEIERVLANDSCTKATRCVQLNITPTIDLKGFETMKRLRFLNVYNLNFDNLLRELDEPVFPNSLQYLRWYRYIHRCLHKTFEANNLVTLVLSYSKIQQLWEEKKVMKQLKFLDLSYSKLLRSLDLGLTPNLEELKLNGCNALVKLYLQDGKVMKQLKFLDLSYSKLLSSLDLGLTPNLEELKLDGCIALEKLYMQDGKVMNKHKVLYLDSTKLRSLDVRSMPNLEKLLISNCDHLVKLYLQDGKLESLKFLHTVGLNLRKYPYYKITWPSNNSLQELEISNEDIEELPSSIGNLHKLVSVVVYDCYKLKYLPESISSLQNLTTLKVRFCGIEELREDIGRLGCLETLDLTCANVKHLPRSICMLKRLKTLVVQYCSVLDKLPEDVGQLESLMKIILEDCNNLRDIPNSICKLKYLQILRLKDCTRLQKLPDRLGDLECLQELDILNTGIIHLPPNISLLKGLKIYKSKLKVFQIKDDYFIHLLCSGYDSKKLQIQGVQNLRSLDLGTCGIKELPEALGHLECLEELNLSFTDITHLPDSICMLKHLKRLVLQCCVLLEKLPNDVGQLESLEELDLSRCYSVREIPSSIRMLKQLKRLDLHHCFCLERLPADVGQLESLEELYLSRCYNIREIPNSICKLKHLKKLNLEGCRKLEKLPDEVGDLECLQVLTIWDTALSHLPESIFSLNDLKIFTENPYEPIYNELLKDDFDQSYESV